MAWAESRETSTAHPQPEGLLEGTTVTRGKARAALLIPQHENKRAIALQPRLLKYPGLLLKTCRPRDQE